jgi:hypothetical protein
VSRRGRPEIEIDDDDRGAQMRHVFVSVLVGALAGGRQAQTVSRTRDEALAAIRNMAPSAGG